MRDLDPPRQRCRAAAVIRRGTPTLRRSSFGAQHARGHQREPRVDAQAAR